MALNFQAAFNAPTSPWLTLVRNAVLGRGSTWLDRAFVVNDWYVSAYEPLLVNSVVGFIGPEYLYDGKQIIRAGLEDHFCGKLLGLPMGCDICYTNHAEADQDDMDMLLTLLGAAGINFIMGIPGSDDVMLNYQTTSFHDALPSASARSTTGSRPSCRSRITWAARAVRLPWLTSFSSVTVTA